MFLCFVTILSWFSYCIWHASCCTAFNNDCHDCHLGHCCVYTVTDVCLEICLSSPVWVSAISVCVSWVAGPPDRDAASWLVLPSDHEFGSWSLVVQTLDGCKKKKRNEPLCPTLFFVAWTLVQNGWILLFLSLLPNSRQTKSNCSGSSIKAKSRGSQSSFVQF